MGTIDHDGARTSRASRLSRASLASLASVAALASLAGCGGVKLGGHTVVAPIARPAPVEAGAGALAGGADAVEVGGPVAVGGPATEAIGPDGQTPRGLAAPDRPTASPEVLAARAATGCFVADRMPHNHVAASDGPVDPWRAVAGGRPRILPHQAMPLLDREGVTCDAAHDHCLRDCSWLVSIDFDVETRPPEANERDATDEGWDRTDPSLPFVAFRSTPATRDNLDVGAVALTLLDPAQGGLAWTFGEVEALDWNAGTLRLRGHRRPYQLAFTRVAVLRYTGDKIEQLR